MPGKDTLGQPTFSDSDPVNLAVDLTSASDSAGTGPYRRGTQSQREALLSPYAGLLWWQTDQTPALYMYTGTGWVLQGVWGTLVAQASSLGGHVQVTVPGTPKWAAFTPSQNSTEMLSKIADAIICEIVPNTVQLRLVRRDTSEWLPSNPLRGYLLCGYL